MELKIEHTELHKEINGLVFYTIMQRSTQLRALRLKQQSLITNQICTNTEDIIDKFSEFFDGR